MSALAGPGDLAGSLGEMAEDQRHRLSVWDAGMLAATFLGLKAQLLPSTELLDSSRHLQPLSGAYPAPICFPLAVSHLWVYGKGASVEQPFSAWRVCRIQPQVGVLQPQYCMGLVLVCDQDPRGSCWVNITLWLKGCKQHR